MFKKVDKYIIYIVAIICILFCISLSIVLLYKKIVPTNGINIYDVVLNGSVKNNKIITKLAVSDQFGKTIKESSSSYVYYDFEIKNTVSEDREYQIYITKGNIDKEKLLNVNYVKFYLTDENNVPLSIFDRSPVPTYNSLKYIEDKPLSKVIYTGKLKGNQKKNFILRVWLSDNYVVDDNVKEFSFSLGVRTL